ncbi:MAG: Pseudogene of AAA family ATPase [Methanobrevibacter sp. CfCl-M3]
MFISFSLPFFIYSVLIFSFFAFLIIPASFFDEITKEGIKEKELIKVLENENPDLIVLAGYMKIVEKNIIKKFQRKIINIHPLKSLFMTEKPFSDCI